MKKYFVFFLLLIPMSLSAASLQVKWNANTESDLKGYKVYSGSTSIDVGNTTEVVIPCDSDCEEVTVQVTAYDKSANESQKSDPVTYNTTPAKPTGLKVEQVQ